MALLRPVLDEELATRFGDVLSSAQVNSLSEIRGSEEPINIRLEKRAVQTGGPIKPRHYQKELSMKALERNVIIYLGTGLGKTFITVLYINSPQIAAKIANGYKVIFMAPTQDLVKQQAEYLHRLLPYKVRVYCGKTSYLGTHIDHWDRATWDMELSKIDVLFMTPQIFTSAISHNLIDWGRLCTVIFDEVHHACKSKKKESGHPYSSVLTHFRNFYTNSRNDCSQQPRLIGLTASLINNIPKCVDDIIFGVKHLEQRLSAKCVTDIQVQETKPLTVIHSYNAPAIDKSNDVLYRLFVELGDKMKGAVEANRMKELESKIGNLSDKEKEVMAYHNRLKLASSGFSIKPSHFHKVLKQVAEIRKNCGLWPFAYICHKLTIALEQHEKNAFVSKNLLVKQLYVEFGAIMKKIVVAINQFLGRDQRGLLLDFSQPKLHALLDILKYEYERVGSDNSEKLTFSCVIFVKSRVEVRALSAWLQKVSVGIPEYSFIKCDYAIGMSATLASKWACITKRRSIEQANMLKSFRNGDLNVVVTTSVLEEGIDLPICSTVIRYDPAGTFRVYVQSRGRARQKVSSYVAMCTDADKNKMKDQLNKFNDFEYRVKDAVQSDDFRPQTQLRPPVERVISRALEDQEDRFETPDSKIQIDPSSAKIILYMYCQRLLRHQPFAEQITYERSQPNHGTYQTTLFLPAGCSIQGRIVGAEKSSVELADSSAVITAFRALYEAKELNEYGIPIRHTEEKIDELLSEHQLAPDFSPLDRSLQGEVVKEGAEEMYYFRAKLFSIDDRLSRGHQMRKYKLVRLIFQAGAEAREDTKQLLEGSTYGLIVDANLSTRFIPDHLFNHYGQFSIATEEIKNDMQIHDYQSHRDYVSFTHRLMATFLKLGFIRKEEFQSRCLFYVVLLNQDNQVDLRKMKNTFHTESCSLRRNDIVKLNSYYCRDRHDSSRLFLVRAVHTDMNAYSKVPGMRFTFEQYMEDNYGPGKIQNPHQQPIIEVMPIARSYARLRRGKKIDSAHTTNSIYYLSQLFDRVTMDEPSIAFQAFNLPLFVYRIYLASVALELDRKLVFDSKEKRDNVILPPELPPESVQPCDKQQGDDCESDHDGGEENSTRETAHEAEFNDDDNSDDGDVSEVETISTVSSYDSEDDNLDESFSDSSDNDEVVANSRAKDIFGKRVFHLRNSGDDYGLEKWDLSQYNVPDLRIMHFEERRSYQHERSLNSGNGQALQSIEPIIEEHSRKILESLHMFRRNILADSDYLDDEQDYSRPGAKVDLSVVSPLEFDRNTTPLRTEAREWGLLEALTQRRAGESYNLEALENVGDSFLKFVVSVVLFKYLNVNEGLLTSARSRLTSNKHFTHLAKKRELGSYAILDSFDESVMSALLGGSSEIKKNRMRPKHLADTVESIVGSYLVYGNEFEAILAAQWLGLNIFRDDTFSEFHSNAVVFSRAPTAMIDQSNPSIRQYFNDSINKLKRVQEIIAYKFNDASYLLQAFTHASATVRCTDTYERLEFLGDAILDYLVTITLYSHGFTTDPGQLTTSRSALVNNCSFAKLCLKYKLDQFLDHANQSLFDELRRVNSVLKEDPDLEFLNMNDFDRICKLLGDIFESVAGAIYLDSGCSLDTVWSIYYPMMKEMIDDEVKNPTKNIIAQIYETFPGAGRVKFDYSEVEQDGEMVRSAKCTIFALGEFFGEGLNKRQARVRAIENVLGNMPPPEVKARLDAEYEAKLRSESGPRVPRQRGQRGRGRGHRGGPSRGGLRGRKSFQPA